jgi:uncharacterized membrane protein YGL010W
MRKTILKIILCPVILLTRLILCAAAFVTSLAGSVIGLSASLFGILSLMAFVTGSWQNGIAFAVLLLVSPVGLPGIAHLILENVSRVLGFFERLLT